MSEREIERERERGREREREREKGERERERERERECVCVRACVRACVCFLNIADAKYRVFFLIFFSYHSGCEVSVCLQKNKGALKG